MRETCKHAIVAASVIGLLMALPARAQLKVGENTSLNLNGNIAFGYNADYSNVVGSDHAFTPNGNADLSGSYYNPNFLSFDIQPFFDQSRTNSTSQSVFQSGGVISSASIFSGSYFPGSVSYSRLLDSSSGYNLPGVGNLTTRGNSDNLAVNWGIRIPNYPKVSFQFGDGHNTSSLFGTDANSNFHTRVFGVTASDTLAGFNLNGGFHRNTNDSVIPALLVGEGPLNTKMSDNSFDANLAHKLPLNGTFSASAARSDIQTNTAGEQFKGTIDTLGSGVGFEPIGNLNVGVDAQYTNNLEGSILQSVLGAGGVVPSSLLSYSTHSTDVIGHATYTLPSFHLTFSGNGDRRDETILGTNLSADTVNGSVTYATDVLRGMLTATAGVTQTWVNGVDASSTLGQFETVSYSRRFGSWISSGSFNYLRNTQTILIGYTTSGYGYSAAIGHKFSPYSFVSLNAMGTKTEYNNVPGSGAFTQNYNSSLTMKRWSVTGSYGRNNGMSILTATGLTPISNPIPIPGQAISFNGTTYGGSASATPRYGFVLSGSYSHTKGSTFGTTAGSENTTAQLNTTLQYKVRQLWILGGYLKLQQQFTITGLPAASYSSYYVGITRWFKFF